MILLTHGRWRVEPVEWTRESAYAVCLLLQHYPTLFTDHVGKQDIQPEMFFTPGLFWMGVYEERVLLGLIYLDFRKSVSDVEIHMAFFDRKPAEKQELLRQLLVVAFEMFPSVQRFTVTVPDIFRHTWKLVRRLGFRWEGTTRAAFSIGGQMRDSYDYGLLRGEL